MNQIKAKKVRLTEHNLEFSYTFDDGTSQTFLVPVKDGEMNLVDLDKTTWQVLNQVAKEERDKFRLKRSLMGLES